METDLMTAQQLRDRAKLYRVLAVAAMTKDLRAALIRAAEGFEAMAAAREEIGLC